MSQFQPLLIEIGCEEIPARMISRAADALGRIVLEIVTEAGLCETGEFVAWGGSRRLAMRIQAVGTRQSDRRERVTGPPASVAYDDAGKLTRAGLGFARKQGVAVEDLQRVETERGEYVILDREVAGRSVGEILSDQLPAAVAAMAFPKTMRWSDGSQRWVRPVHWLVALHGSDVLPLEIFGVSAGRDSIGHRFLSSGPVSIPAVDNYIETLRGHHVVVDPAERRTQVKDRLQSAAAELGGLPRADAALLDEVLNLVEWPGVVGGNFEEDFLRLPREILVVTLRYHQKCFSVEDTDGGLLPAFLAIANTDRDPSGHVRRGNEWVVSGRLEDARFFWKEDLKQSLAQRSATLARVVFHTEVGSYQDKSERMSAIAGKLGAALDLSASILADASAAALLAKNDLVTGTVGEFPELQGQIGGLMLREEGASTAIADGVYEHYLPEGPDDPAPRTEVGSLVSLSDKLDSIAVLIGSGETPTGSRDPFALRRASSGSFRILLAARVEPDHPDRACRNPGAQGTRLALDFLRRAARGRPARQPVYTVKEMQSVRDAPAIARRDRGATIGR